MGGDEFAAECLAGGRLYLAGIAFVDRVNDGTTNDRVLRARVGSVALLVALAAHGSPPSPLAFTATVSLVLLALTTFETLRGYQPGLGELPTD